MKREKASNWSTDFQAAIEATGLADDIVRCMACGKCSGVCPLAAVNPSYGPRQFIREVLLGNDERILHSEEMWRCFWCANCASTCPSEIMYPLLMLALRYYALDHGAGQKYVIPLFRFVRRAYEEGVTFQPTSPKRLDIIRACRSKIGLVPQRIVSDKGIEEYQKLYEIAGTLDWMNSIEAKAAVPLDFAFAENKILPEDHMEGFKNKKGGEA